MAKSLLESRPALLISRRRSLFDDTLAEDLLTLVLHYLSPATLPRKDGIRGRISDRRQGTRSTAALYI